MYPAILVTFSPSKRFGWRLRAKMGSDTLFVPWDDNITYEQNYEQAAKSLIKNLDLDWCYTGGPITVNTYTFVRSISNLNVTSKDKARKYSHIQEILEMFSVLQQVEDGYRFLGFHHTEQVSFEIWDYLCNVSKCSLARSLGYTGVPPQIPMEEVYTAMLDRWLELDIPGDICKSTRMTRQHFMYVTTGQVEITKKT